MIRDISADIIPVLLINKKADFKLFKNIQDLQVIMGRREDSIKSRSAGRGQERSRNEKGSTKRLRVSGDKTRSQGPGDKTRSRDQGEKVRSRESGRRYNSSGSFHDSVSQVRPHFETVIGFHAIEEMLKDKSIEGTLFVSGRGKRHEKITFLARSRNIKISKVSDEALQRKSPDIDPRGVVLEVTGKKEEGKETSLKAFLDRTDSDRKENSLVLILDSITDPHNLGAILRSADQFGADLVILPGRRSAGDNATVRKISSGASEYVPQAVENLSRAVDLLKKSGYWIYAADMGGEDSWKLNLKGRTALILGSEGEGVSRILTEKSDSIIKIPASGHVDSFNVSVAAGILMYEAVRQKNL